MSLVHYDLTDQVGTITLDSPHNRNALSRQLVTELFERLETAKEELAAEPEFDVTVTNDEVRRAAEEIVSLMGLDPAAHRD